jgi:RNA polymerase sigma-70 factor (ECF subfamily)
MRDTPSAVNSTAINELLNRAALGDQEAWGDLLNRYRDRLHTMVALRLDRRLKGRLDASDIVQDALLDASLHLAEYARERRLPFYLWLRAVTGQRMVALHRHHLGVQARDAGREISLYQGALPQASSTALAARLLGHDARPSEAMQKAEQGLLLHEALNRMDPLDREVLALRHFEQLSNAEAAQILNLRESAASKRYVRALVKLKEILTNLPGGKEIWS